MSLLGTKSLLSSKTFWGIAIAAVTPILNILGLPVGPVLAQSGIQLVGLVLALIGRIRAKETIGGLISS